MVKLKKIKNYRREKKQKNLIRFSVISFALIFSFFSLPTINKFIDKNINFKKSIISNAGVNFDQELEKRKKIIQKNENPKSEKLSLKNIFADIDFFSTDDEGQNSIRLDARTIEQLFIDTNYTLDKVRETKLVNIGNKIDHFPVEIKSIDNSKKRKNFFIQIVLPLIVEENAKIRLDRKELFRILGKNINNKKEKQWLKEKFKQYGLNDGDFYSLKIRMDEIPVSLALAQAAKETGWGTSRFAQEGNALFGQWTWNGNGIKPAGVDKDAKHKVAKFSVLKASVRAYQRNLNTHKSYIEFRKERAIQRDNNEKLNSLVLVNYLDKYAETGQQYIDVLKKIIKQNSLTDFDDVNVMPTSNKIKKLI
tara:strand:- start:557 stop:1648 length:1092 start_codon:yes stop_codon:yes gene_type:complete